jgi:hypothetical protein
MNHRHTVFSTDWRMTGMEGWEKSTESQGLQLSGGKSMVSATTRTFITYKY